VEGAKAINVATRSQKGQSDSFLDISCWAKDGARPFEQNRRTNAMMAAHRRFKSVNIEASSHCPVLVVMLLASVVVAFHPSRTT
jgi:hypothetical protein